MSVSVLLFAVLLVLCSHADAKFPVCSLNYCVTNGARARCLFTGPSGKTELVRCSKWAKIDPDACPDIVCQVACPELPDKGAVCEDACPACRFPFESCIRRFKLFKAPKEKCDRQRAPKCSLKFCAENGFRAKCRLKGKTGSKVIRCGRWPKIVPDVCPNFICLILCDIPAKTGPVCSNCPDCAFIAPSCKSNFKLYRAKNCSSSPVPSTVTA